MAKRKVMLTRKIQILVDEADPEKRRGHQEKLEQWQNLVFKASNIAISHQFMQEHLKDMLYLKDEAKVKLVDYKQDPEGILTTSRLNTTYQLLSKQFKGQMHSNIITNLNTSLFKAFCADRQAYWRGDQSLRNYRKNMPIPFSGNLLRWRDNTNERDFKFVLFKIPFRTFLGRDRGHKKKLIQQIKEGQIKIAQCAIRREKSGLFLFLCFEQPLDQVVLRQNVVAEASLSLEHPVVLQIGHHLYRIGNKEEFLYRRLAIQAARHRIASSCTYNNGGHGKKKKLKRLDTFQEKERNYVQSKLHLYSRQLIDFCITHQAGTLLLVNQTHKNSVAKEDAFLLRNWGYYGLTEMIRYKAELAGIHLIVE
ncbi:hypothetical protein M8998_13420 [Sphingobacterium sp. lm-10]|uniref:hypothetical protein n=1 Tax=Sphingobacterium sp. lm-10 TaxID=2944904 RepID=UPI0020210897|nr:hypothetical protein [Sphingobacterium sp. lm-10]MCL7988944.1 hypothetical protein [Sphingobacterium sp. lm-10]